MILIIAQVKSLDHQLILVVWKYSCSAEAYMDQNWEGAGTGRGRKIRVSFDKKGRIIDKKGRSRENSKEHIMKLHIVSDYTNSINIGVLEHRTTSILTLYF
ncbi:unnamed protein product [Amoebophrya sp. A25]|nr:unnamed protein product [Amoebophrya sp. A25]|eukprot:GSA25T00015877001.1